jgi:hypothetical protein
VNVEEAVEILNKYGFSFQYDGKNSPQERWNLICHVNSFNSIEEMVDWVIKEFEEK